jgi:hypothetical protein
VAGLLGSSVARAREAKLSMMRFTHSICAENEREGANQRLRATHHAGGSRGRLAHPPRRPCRSPNVPGKKDTHAGKIAGFRAGRG